MNIKAILALFALGLLGLLSEFLFTPAHLYYEIPWLDIPMHVVSGFVCGIFFYNLIPNKFSRNAFLLSLLGTLVVATIWEIYEYVRYASAISGWDGWVDTIKDIINGVLGAALGVLLSRKSI